MMIASSHRERPAPRTGRLLLIAIGLIAVVLLAEAPVTAWPRLVRLDAVLVPALVLAVTVLRPWRWNESRWRTVETWIPSGLAVAIGALVVGVLLFWLVLTRFQSGSINAVDFTVYFDRPCFQTVQGRPLFVETADVPSFSWRGELAVHAFWAMLPLCSVYTLAATPLWLLAVSVIAVVAGAVHVLRVMRYLGAGGLLAVATALVFALNDNTARTLNYGFHPEVLYAWFVPWLLDAGLRGNRLSFTAAAVACVLVKEDACMVLFAASVALGLYRFRAMNRGDVALFLIVPVALALTNLIVYFRYVVPALTPTGQTYANFWANYGPTPMRALVGMMMQPGSVLASTLTSGFFRTVILPHLFLPMIGWRWTLGIAPLVMIYGTSANEQLRAFGIYYAIVLVPFLVIGASVAVMTLGRYLAPSVRRAELAGAGVVLLGALLVGFGYSLRPWRGEIAAVPDAVARLADERVVLVQSGLYPHAGYDARIQLLTPETLHSPRYAGAAVLIAPMISAYPFQSDDLDGLRRLQPIRVMPAGLLAVRRPSAPVL